MDDQTTTGGTQTEPSVLDIDTPASAASSNNTPATAVVAEVETLASGLAETVANLERLKSEKSQLEERLKELQKKHDELEEKITSDRSKAEDLAERVKSLTGQL